nr:PREDICTED: uncharacterized protein LOC104153062 isoform X2 [Struthio camelus australis]
MITLCRSFSIDRQGIKLRYLEEARLSFLTATMLHRSQRSLLFPPFTWAAAAVSAAAGAAAVSLPALHPGLSDSRRTRLHIAKEEERWSCVFFCWFWKQREVIQSAVAFGLPTTVLKAIRLHIGLLQLLQAVGPTVSFVIPLSASLNPEDLSSLWMNCSGRGKQLPSWFHLSSVEIIWGICLHITSCLEQHIQLQEIITRRSHTRWKSEILGYHLV